MRIRIQATEPSGSGSETLPVPISKLRAPVSTTNLKLELREGLLFDEHLAGGVGGYVHMADDLVPRSGVRMRSGGYPFHGILQ
jgi:hypothetical protein